MRISRKLGMIIIAGLFLEAFAQQPADEFDPGRWDLSRAKVVEHLGRKALTGTAFLKDIALADGVIELDIATTERARSYPGVLFRVKDAANYERVYIRPHRSPYYDDALQYAPVFNGVDSWQLYNGPGETAELDILPGRWNRLKIVVAGGQARVFWNGETSPALIIDQLAHTPAAGTIGLSGPMDGTAFFSGLSYKIDDTLALPVLAAREPVCGAIRAWEISEPYPLAAADFTVYPEEQFLAGMKWRPVQADGAGLVDVSRYFARKNRGGDCILARTTITADGEAPLRLGFGYSDFVTVYLNGRPVYFGNSAYRSRDLSFLGIVGYFDNLFLPVTKGVNELLVRIGENMGGWGFCFRREDEICRADTVREAWAVKGPLAVPECVAYDPLHGVLYVSNYFNQGQEFLSKISLSGEVLAREWITGLRMPTGMCQKGNTLYVVDRGGLNVIDASQGTITEKIPLTGMRMPNDVAMDGGGNLYISDTPANAVFRYVGGKLEKWLDGLDGPNALFCEEGRLLIGQNGKLLEVDPDTRAIGALADFEIGSNIDGIQADGRGSYLVSDYNGRLYLVSKDGKKSLLLDTATPGANIADFAFVPGRDLVVIPTFSDNSVVAYLFK